MMNLRILPSVFCLIPVGLLMLACGAQPPAPQEESAASSTEIAAAVQATLTAAAQKTEISTLAEAAPTAAPSPTPSLNVSATPTPPPTSTPSPVPTLTPTNALEPEEPSPTPTRPLFAVVPVDGGRAGLDGQIILPGFSQDQVSDPMVFRDKLVFRVEAYNPSVGTTDGAGIENVKITINREDDGQTVHERTENNASYCVFGGGEPDCNVFVFANNHNIWPESNEPILDGPYRAFIFITTTTGVTEEWNWGFRIEGVATQASETGAAEIRMKLVQVSPDDTALVVDQALVFQIEAYVTGYGNQDGQGISYVDMKVFPAGGGGAVHERTEQNAAYCAFGGGEPDCNLWNFAENGDAWPSGELIQPGRYILQATAYSVDGHTANLSTEIGIELRQPPF